MAFLKSKQRPIYLHFLDRELRRAEGVNYTDKIILETLVIAVFNSFSYCYSSASLLQESNRLFPESIRTLKELERFGFVHLLTNEYSFDEFIQSRREIYAHRESRYPMYFDKADGTLWPEKPIFITTSTTSILRTSLLTWLDNPTTVTGLNKNKLDSALLQDFERKLFEQKDKAVTLDLLLSQDQLNQDQIRRNSGRIVSYFYTKRYLDLFNGDILCNLPNLSFYNSLSASSNLNDIELLRSILQCCLIPDYFFELGVFSLIKFIGYINNASFRYLQIEFLCILKALSDITDEKNGDISENIRLFTSNFKADSINKCMSIENHLTQSYIALSNTAMLLSKIHNGFEKPYIMAKDELTTINKVLVVTATKIETTAFMSSMAAIGLVPTSFPIDKLTFWNFGIIGNSQILMLKLGDMGSKKVSGSTIVIKEALLAINFNYVIMLGIAFGLKKDKQRIGTILVSRELEDYESAKVTKDGLIQRGHNIPAGATLFNRFDSASMTYTKNEVEVGLIISGDKLVDDEGYVNQLKASFSEAIGGEMEGTGLQSSCHREAIEWILIKGICDWGYEKQHANKDRDQQLAIENVCDYFIYTLKSYPL